MMFSKPVCVAHVNGKQGFWVEKPKGLYLVRIFCDRIVNVGMVKEDIIIEISGKKELLSRVEQFIIQRI